MLSEAEALSIFLYVLIFFISRAVEEGVKLLRGEKDGIQQVCMDRKQDFRRRHGMPLRNEGKNKEAHYRNGCRGCKIVHKQFKQLKLS